MAMEVHRNENVINQAAVAAVEEEEEQFGPLLVAEFEKHGISVADIRKLQEAGFYTIESVVYAPKKKLTDIKVWIGT